MGFGEKEDRSEQTRGWMGDGCREGLLSLQNHEQESGAEEFVLLLAFGVGEEGGGSSDHAALVKDKPFVGGLQTHVCLHDGADHRPHPRGVKGGEFVGVL